MDSGAAAPDAAEQKTSTQSKDSRAAKWDAIVKAATQWNAAHADLVAEFNKLTGGKCGGSNAGVSVRAVRQWQMAHGLKADGKVGKHTLEAARAEAPEEKDADAGAEATKEEAHAAGAADPKQGRKAHHRKPETINFADDEGSTIEVDAPVTPESEGGGVDAAAVIGEGDTSHNRHGEPEHKIEGKDVAEVSTFIMETIERAGVKAARVPKIATKLSQCRSAGDVFEVLKSELEPDTLLEIGGAVAKHFGWHEVAEIAESAAPAVAGALAGLEYAKLSMEYIIGAANEKGRQSGQLNRYAAAWAFRFLDDGYAPEMLAEIDEQTTLMNTCSRLGIEDAERTLAKLGERAPGMRRQLIGHYGGVGQARENLVLELFKQAGVK